MPDIPDPELSVVQRVASASRIAGVPPVMTQAAATQKYISTVRAAQIGVFGKVLSAYMADYDLEMKKYSVAKKTTNDEDWDRLAKTPPPDAEWIPLNLWSVVSAAQTRKYAKLKKVLDDDLARAKAMQKIEDTVEKVIDTFDIFKYVPYILIGGGVLVAAYVIKK
jgi:hypothetical protein